MQAAANSASQLASSSSLSSAQTLSVLSAVEQARTVFAAEATRFANAAQIDKCLRAAIYFLRSAAALLDAGAVSSSAKTRIQSAATRLRQAYDLMQASASSSGSNAGSLATNTVPDIGAADTRSGASYAPAIAPSSLAVILGDGTLGAKTEIVTIQQLLEGQLPFELGGLSVVVGGRASPLVYASPARLVFIVPDLGAAAGTVEVIVTSNDGSVAYGTVTVVGIAPGLFAKGDRGTGEAVALDEVDSAPASAFDVERDSLLFGRHATRITLFATGLSRATNSDPSNDLKLGDQTLANVAESVSVEARTQDGRVFQLPVEFAGATLRPSLFGQIIIRLIPELRGAGTVELTLVVGGQRSNSATINVR